MSKELFDLYSLQLPPKLNPDLLPRRPTRRQAVIIHCHYFGPLSLRSIINWPLEWLIVNGHATVDLDEFLAEARSRVKASLNRSSRTTPTAA